MRLTLVAVLLTLVATSNSRVVAQIPLPAALMEGRLVFLAGEGMKRGWLNWAAEEIVKFDRFELVGDPEDAELIFTMVKTGEGAGAAGIPITGVGVFVVPITVDGFRFLVHRASDGRSIRSGSGWGCIRQAGHETVH